MNKISNKKTVLTLFFLGFLCAPSVSFACIPIFCPIQWAMKSMPGGAPTLDLPNFPFKPMDYIQSKAETLQSSIKEEKDKILEKTRSVASPTLAKLKGNSFADKAPAVTQKYLAKIGVKENDSPDSKAQKIEETLLLLEDPSHREQVDNTALRRKVTMEAMLELSGAVFAMRPQLQDALNEVKELKREQPGDINKAWRHNYRARYALQQAVIARSEVDALRLQVYTTDMLNSEMAVSEEAVY